MVSTNSALQQIDAICSELLLKRAKDPVAVRASRVLLDSFAKRASVCDVNKEIRRTCKFGSARIIQLPLEEKVAWLLKRKQVLA